MKPLTLCSLAGWLATAILLSPAFSQEFDPKFPHTFTDTQGRQMRALVQKLEGGQVTILREGGNVFTVATSVFSEADQDYFRQWDLDTKGLPQSLDERIQPGKVVEIPFPELPEMMQGGETVLKFRVPENFAYPKPVPVFVWMNGGKGNNNIEMKLFPKEDFLIIGLSYPVTSESSNDCINPPTFSTIHDYQQVMLDKVFELIPNIDRRLCAMGGFSNGGHTTCSYVTEDHDKYGEFFNTLIVIDGGGDTNGNTRGLRDRHIFYGFASEGKHIPFQETMRDELFSEATSDLYTELQFPGGHAFPPDVRTMVADWVRSTVIPARLID